MPNYIVELATRPTVFEWATIEAESLEEAEEIAQELADDELDTGVYYWERRERNYSDWEVFSVEETGPVSLLPPVSKSREVITVQQHLQEMIDIQDRLDELESEDQSDLMKKFRRQALALVEWSEGQCTYHALGDYFERLKAEPPR